MKRKIIVSFLSVLLVSSTLLAPISFASNDKGNNDIIQPQAITYPVEKPIHDTAFISNSQLGEMLDQRRQSVGWFSIITTLASLIPAFTAVGAANGVAVAFSGMSETQLERAYRNGNDIYVAILNANGEPTGSLSKEAVVVPSGVPIIFSYQP
ncbi:hypothetical protein GMD78_17460 [Ornithinibacillus sp. L9]|uniref:Uncharacterized protein n=1 Tax=Ornithinibacillus caprae TaxID=2678566 RepID=A0A6N8FLA9_9BACI|nr:hypothetical protein [Ornithinibacillus caprae]MUK90163.1 hypothetical protein [Ornithinibacillus caprae]